MTDDFKMAMECIFEVIWQLFTGWTFPGTNVSPAEFALFVLFASVIYRFLGDISGNILSGSSQPTRNGRGGSVRIPYKKE